MMDQKINPGLAVVLALCFAPIGIAYASISGFLIMFAIFVVGIIPLSFMGLPIMMLGILIWWALCGVYAYCEATSHNAKVDIMRKSHG